MNHLSLTQAVAELSKLQGMRGCALVESVSGLVWAVHGELAASDSLWEAAVDYWRLHTRNQAHFESLGALRAAVMYHSTCILTVFRCTTEPDLLLVAAGIYETVDWRELQRMNRKLGELIAGTSS